MTLATPSLFRGWVHTRKCTQCKHIIARSEPRYQCDLCDSSRCASCVEPAGCIVADLQPLPNGATVWNARTCEYCVVDDDYGIKCQVTLLDSSEGKLVARRDLIEVEATLRIVSADPDSDAGGVTKYGIEVCFPQFGVAYTIRRRYNEFLSLKQQLEAGRMETSDKMFPVKHPPADHGGKARVVEERRAQLGVWLADTASKQTSIGASAQSCWVDFLEIPTATLSAPVVQFGVTFRASRRVST